MECFQILNEDCLYHLLKYLSFDDCINLAEASPDLLKFIKTLKFDTHEISIVCNENMYIVRVYDNRQRKIVYDITIPYEQLGRFLRVIGNSVYKLSLTGIKNPSDLFEWCPCITHLLLTDCCLIAIRNNIENLEDLIEICIYDPENLQPFEPTGWYCRSANVMRTYRKSEQPLVKRARML